MSGVVVVRYVLGNNGPLLAVVPGARIMAGKIVEGTPMPAVSIQSISGVPFSTVEAKLPGKMFFERVQTTALASDYDTQLQVESLIRAALPNMRGTINGVIVDSIRQLSFGSDQENPLVPLFAKPQDFMVTWKNPPA